MRRLCWRLGRRLYMWGRGDGANDPRVNGEYWLLRQVLASGGGPKVLLDVGANLGNWTFQALQLAGPGNSLTVHAFEPSRPTRASLEERFHGLAAVRIEPCALSEREGEAEFFSILERDGTNSLSPVSGPNVEVVRVSTLDGFLERSGLPRVAMAKIDAEGFDLLVLRGAEKALREGRIDVLQFEYNWRWLVNHVSLRDVFELIADRPYRFGKLVGEGIEYYRTWHPELDRYFENNYVLVRDGLAFEQLGRTVEFDASNAPVPAGTTSLEPFHG